jgi:glycosyltransferase involved in cell wall biosynthesis
MNILIITQTVDQNDPVLGFFCDWILEFSRAYDTVTVITLGVGRYSFPTNVHVYSLGKEKNKNRLTYLCRFFSLIFKKRRDYDVVFVHMNPIYVVLAGWYWRLLGKRIFLWYTHRQVDIKLCLAELFSHRVFTASPEGFQLPSKKKTVVGHGINTKRFIQPVQRDYQRDVLTILHVGRITPIKNIDMAIEVLRVLQKKNIPARLSLIGPAVTKQELKEKDRLLELVHAYGLDNRVTFLGSLSFEKLPLIFSQADVSVNLAPTGGMDKAVLESMLSGTIVFVSNTTFRPLLGAYAQDLIFNERDAVDLSEKLEAFWKKEKDVKERTALFLQERAKEEHNLSTLIKKVYAYGLE